MACFRDMGSRCRTASRTSLPHSRWRQRSGGWLSVGTRPRCLHTRPVFCISTTPPQKKILSKERGGVLFLTMILLAYLQLRPWWPRCHFDHRRLEGPHRQPVRSLHPERWPDQLPRQRSGAAGEDAHHTRTLPLVQRRRRHVAPPLRQGQGASQLAQGIYKS